jgi:hypothetical protein
MSKAISSVVKVKLSRGQTMKTALIFVVLFVAVSCEDPVVAPVCPNDNGLPYINCKDCSAYAVG